MRGIGAHGVTGIAPAGTVGIWPSGFMPVNGMVCTCGSHRLEILSESLFWRGWRAANVTQLVCENCGANDHRGCDICPFAARNSWIVRGWPLRRGAVIFVSLVVGGDGSVCDCRWIRQPALLVSTSAGADHCRIRCQRGGVFPNEIAEAADDRGGFRSARGRRFWPANLQRNQEPYGACDGRFADAGTCVEAAYAARIIHHNGRLRDSDCFILCRAQGLAFYGEQRDL